MTQTATQTATRTAPSRIVEPIPTSTAGCCGSPSTADAADPEALLPTLKALADPVRLRIVLRIAQAPSTVCACSMQDVFGVSQPTLSHHLKRLVEAGLLTREMRGSWAHFALRPEGFAALASLLPALARPTNLEEPHEC